PLPCCRLCSAPPRGGPPPSGGRVRKPYFFSRQKQISPRAEGNYRRRLRLSDLSSSPLPKGGETHATGFIALPEKQPPSRNRESESHEDRCGPLHCAKRRTMLVRPPR